MRSDALKPAADRPVTAPGVIPLHQLAPDGPTLLKLSVEDLAAVLLEHLLSRYKGRLGPQNFFADALKEADYGADQDAVDQALMEAWAWLVCHGLLYRDYSTTGNLFCFSRKAKTFIAPNDAGVIEFGDAFDAYLGEATSTNRGVQSKDAKQAEADREKQVDTASDDPTRNLDADKKTPKTAKTGH